MRKANALQEMFAEKNLFLMANRIYLFFAPFLCNCETVRNQRLKFSSSEHAGINYVYIVAWILLMMDIIDDVQT